MLFVDSATEPLHAGLCPQKSHGIYLFPVKIGRGKKGKSKVSKRKRKKHRQERLEKKNGGTRIGKFRIERAKVPCRRAPRQKNTERTYLMPPSPSGSPPPKWSNTTRVSSSFREILNMSSSLSNSVTCVYVHVCVRACRGVSLHLRQIHRLHSSHAK